MFVSCVEQDCKSSKHPEPSTVSFQINLWHWCAREYKSSIFCENARVYSISISKHAKMQCNQQPTHQTHRSTWITISKTSQNIHKMTEQIHCANLQHSTTKRIVQFGQNSKQNQQRLHSFQNFTIITLQAFSFSLLFHFFKTCLFHASSKNVDPPNALSQALWSSNSSTGTKVLASTKAPSSAKRQECTVYQSLNM